jgi:hypothetical protein
MVSLLTWGIIRPNKQFYPSNLSREGWFLSIWLFYRAGFSSISPIKIVTVYTYQHQSIGYIPWLIPNWLERRDSVKTFNTSLGKLQFWFVLSDGCL